MRKKIVLALMTFITLFLPIVTLNAIAIVNDGDVINGTKIEGKLENPGDVKVTKQVTKLNNEGLYKVEFDIRGLNVERTRYKPIYVVVLLDKSSSMHGGCYGCSQWNNAINAAKDLADEIINEFSNSNIGLITFNTAANTLKTLSRDKFDGVSFGFPSGPADLEVGIDSAVSSLNSITEDSIKAIVLLSRGDFDMDRYNDALTKINAAKVSGIKFYSMGFGANNTQTDRLKDISSSGALSNVDGVVSSLKTLAEEKYNVPAGTNATLNDTIGENFEFVVGSQTEGVTHSNKVVTFGLDEITEVGTTISFNIQIDIDGADEWNHTNKTHGEGVKLSYTNNKDQLKKIVFKESPKVYWIKKYSYTINYYQDSLSGTLLGTKNGMAPHNTLIETVDQTLFILAGYKFKESNLPYTILKTQDNVINVVYGKRNDLSYTVEYYYDEVLDTSKTYTVNGATYGESVTEFIDKSGASYILKSCTELTIELENNVLKVYYQKIKMASNEITPPKTGIDNSNEFIPIVSSSIVVLFLLKRKV